MLASARPENFARKFVITENFKSLYSEVMGLVERTANYLDVDGRRAREQMQRPLDILYSRTSMQLTTQLMQIAALAMVLREIGSNSMSVDEALETVKVKKVDQVQEISIDQLHGLPGTLLEIVHSGNLLRDRILTLYTGLASTATETPYSVSQHNEVHNQLAFLAGSFH